MKTPKRSITLFSFFPAVALLATPLLFSTLAPAMIDSSDWNVPQSFMTTDEILEAQSIRNKDIGEVKFLQYDRDYIYRADDTDDDTVAVDDSRNAPALTDQGEIDTAYVLQNPEFQRQVEEVSAQATQAGAAMPPLLTLVALFAFAVATGTSSLKDFVKFSTYTEKVKKTIQVTKKVAKTVYKTITETVARKVKTVKTIAYTAYETVKNVSYNTRTWVTEAVKHKPVTWHPIEQMEMKAKFLLDNINKYQGKFTRSYAKNVRYYTPNLSEYAYLKKEYDDVSSGRKVGRYAQNVQHRVWNERQTLDSQAGQFFDGIADPKLREKLLSEYKSLNDVTYTEKTTHSETTPVVTFTQKPYTAYRDEVETKTVYDTISREVPETIYEDVIEDREITEDVTKYSFTPLNEKIELAMGYLKNYQNILRSPSNRNFFDDVLAPNKNLPLFAGATTVYDNLQGELKNANIYNLEKTDPEEVKKILRKHNEFVYSMKTKLAQIEQGKTPEEQMGILFGKTYTDSIRESENAIASAEAEEKALSARFEEIGEMERRNKISTGYARSLYNSAKKNRDQLYRRKRDALKNLKEGKEYYTRRFNGTISSLQNLSFLRSLEDWRRTLDYGQRATSSRLVPFTTANGSVIYRKPAQATTQAEPKKTIPQPANLATANAPYADAFLRVPSLQPKQKTTLDLPYPIYQLGYVPEISKEVRNQLMKTAKSEAKNIFTKSPLKAYINIDELTDKIFKEKLQVLQSQIAEERLSKVTLNADIAINTILHATKRPVYNLTEEQWKNKSGMDSDTSNDVKAHYKNWRDVRGSRFHVGKDKEAIDFNLGGGEFDKGMPVLSSTAGEVVHVDRSGFGYVVLEHTAQVKVNGERKEITWWTGYMHLANIQVELNQKVNLQTHIGDVSNVTKFLPMNSHLHYAVFYDDVATTWDKANTLNLETWLKHHRINVN